MFTHKQIWAAIDALAAKHGLSASGLAKRAGLDPTSFNPSKRQGPEGRERWPTTESLAKVLNAVGGNLEEFTAMVVGGAGPENMQVQIPVIGMAQAGKGGFFDDAGFPVGGAFDEINAPGVKDANAYALEITGDSMLPVYREGDIIIVSPNAVVRRGDRVVVKTKAGEVMAKLLQRQSASHLELASFNPEHGLKELPIEEIQWMARIIWASQ